MPRVYRDAVAMIEPSTSSPTLYVQAKQVLRARKIWIVPILTASVFAALMAAAYFGSVINPTGHMRGLPVMIVEQDSGATVDGHQMNVGASLTSSLEHTSAVSSRLKLMPASLHQAQAEMDKGGAYATLVVPATLTRSALLAAGITTPGTTPPATAAVQLQENTRLGTLGVSLASGVITPAIAKISPQIGTHLSAVATTASKANPVLDSRVKDPITLTSTTYRPLPDHSALGLSAFYIALLALIGGFVGATLINSSVDSALGYAPSQLGARFSQRRPMPINRTQTFLVKAAIATVAVPVLTGVVLLVTVGALGMYAPQVIALWGLLSLAALMIGLGTLALLAIFGSIGQLLAVLLLVYLSLASSGGTVPIQALPGFFRIVGHVEPLRNTLLGTRAILYFGARGDAGLTTSLTVLACEVVFWTALGLAAALWYDRKGLDRISPELIAHINRAVDDSRAQLSSGAELSSPR